jgi:hypothetical protein
MDWKRLSPLSFGRRVDDASLGSGPDVSFVGGIRVGSARVTLPFFLGWNASFPFVRLSLFSDGLRLERSHRSLRYLIPTWEVRYDDLIEVQAVGRLGIRFRTRSTNEWAIFWAKDRSAVMRAVAEHGVVVNTEAVRFHYLNPGRS